MYPLVCIVLAILHRPSALVMAQGERYRGPDGPPWELLRTHLGRSKWVCNLELPMWNCTKCEPECKVTRSRTVAVCFLENFPAQNPKWGCTPWDPSSDNVEIVEEESSPQQIEPITKMQVMKDEQAREFCLEELRCLPSFMCGTLNEQERYFCRREMEENGRRFSNAIFKPPRTCVETKPRCEATVDAMDYLKRGDAKREIFESFFGFGPNKTCFDRFGCVEARSCRLFIPLGRTIPVEEEIDRTKIIFNDTRAGIKVQISAVLPKNDAESWEAIRGMFQSERKLVLIIHGFKQNINDTIYDRLANAVKKTYEGAVIAQYDWSSAAHFEGSNLDYNNAAGNVMVLGDVLGDLILKLKEDTRLEPKNVTIISFSLGAQISGIAGRKIAKTGDPIGEIIALDPAAPCFCEHNVAPGPDSAVITRIIHTDVAIGSKVIAYGCALPGHFSYYINGGSRQPGCGLGFFWAPFGCFHNFATKYFIRHLELPDRCQISGQLCRLGENPLLNACTGRNITLGKETILKSESEPRLIRVSTENPLCI